MRRMSGCIGWGGAAVLQGWHPPSSLPTLCPAVPMNCDVLSESLGRVVPIVGGMAVSSLSSAQGIHCGVPIRLAETPLCATQI